jgi:DNA-binding protein H-NS
MSDQLTSLSTKELIALRHKIDELIARRVEADKKQLEENLRELRQFRKTKSTKPRKAYPKVLPKYRNPRDESQVWSGRGLRPKWLQEALAAGGNLKKFEISNQTSRKGRNTTSKSR